MGFASSHERLRILSCKMSDHIERHTCILPEGFVSVPSFMHTMQYGHRITLQARGIKDEGVKDSSAEAEPTWITSTVS